MWIIDKLLARPIQIGINAGVATAVANLYNQNVFQWLNEGGVIIDEDGYDYIKSFRTVGAVYEAVDLIVKKIIECPRIVYEVKDEKEYKKYLALSKSPENFQKAALAKAKALTEVAIPAIDNLLEQPNARQNGDALIEMIAGLLLLRGNAFAYGNGSLPSNKKWSEIFAFPAMLNIVTGGPLEPIKEYYFNWDTENRFPAAQIAHFKTFNPQYSPMGQQLYGMSPLHAYLYSMDIIKNSDKQADKQLKNGGKMGFISPKNKEDALGDDQKKDLGQSLTSAHGSNDYLARIIPSSIPLDWTEIGLSSADMQLLDISGAKADDIYRAYHIPLQFRTQDSSTYNNLPIASRKFIYDAVAPIARRIDSILTEFICLPYRKSDGKKYVIKLDYTALPELSDDIQKTVEWLKNADFLTRNEKREVIGYGQSAQPGMDEIFVASTQVRLQDIMDGKIDQSRHTSQDPPAGAAAPTQLNP